MGFWAGTWAPEHIFLGWGAVVSSNVFPAFGQLALENVPNNTECRLPKPNNLGEKKIGDDILGKPRVLFPLSLPHSKKDSKMKSQRILMFLKH